MKATELRIGNIMSIGSINEPVKVIAINENETVDFVSIEFPLTKFRNNTFAKPIPLTEEWLVKLGYSKSDVLNNLFEHPNKNFINLRLNEDGYFEDYETFYGISVKLISVHQLQNLYFALTGEEL